MPRKIFLLLTEFPTREAKLMGVLTGFRYTHASVGLDEDMNTFYTFRYRGFFTEKITRYIRSDRLSFPCQLYELEVSEDVYQSIKTILENFEKYNNFLRYTKFGLVMSLFHIPYRRRYRYFCSHFVADVLKYSLAAKLKKKSSLYLPNDLRKLDGMNRIFQGDLQGYLNQYKILPC